MPRSRRSWVQHARPSALALFALVAMASCVSGPFQASRDQPRPGATDPASAHERAQAVLAAWADAVGASGRGPVTPVGDLTGQVGDWERAVGENNKRALMAGLVASEEPLSDTSPPDGQVSWQDGSTAEVHVLSAQAALAAIGSTTAAPCGDCAMLSVTSARLTSGQIQTSRGPATAPLWEFTVRGSAVRVTRLAVANAVVGRPIREGDPTVVVTIDAASGTVGGHELTVAFTGAPDPGDVACGEDYTGEAVESELAVVVIVTRHPHPDPAGVFCALVGARRTATATMAAPLGDRVVLDPVLGTPVATVLAP